MYPKWVQADGFSGTTAWCKEDEDKYYASIRTPKVTVSEPVTAKKGPGRPRKE
jgi:hypothetical protein